jgi:hypothetical protein
MVPLYPIIHRKGAHISLAPLVFLDKSDIYNPSDMGTHVANTHATMNFEHVDGAPDALNLNNLKKLNRIDNADEIYLTSTEPLFSLPEYLKGQKPDPKTLQTKNATSCVVIVVDKGEGVMDAFYMYFYTFNEGPSALGHTAGNHLGDWYDSSFRGPKKFN